MRRIFYSFFALLLLVQFTYAQEIKVIKDGDLQGGQTYNWTSDIEYHLDGYVFLEEGGVLNIEAGTTIKGLGQESITDGNPFSALLIARGAQIFARGTEDEPIVFTSEFDDGTLTGLDRGLWGGLAICGNGKVSANNETFEARMEGFSEAFEPVALYGGEDDGDNSGVLKYVSIRHGGAEIGTGDEINGLSLGGVGSGTTIEHIEIFANSDDGIEIWGGAVGIKYASVAFCADDSFDWDLGWNGKGQFWFVVQGADESDNGGEFDGAQPDEPLEGRDVSSPTVYNATWIGAGSGAVADNTTGWLFRDGSAGTIVNSIVTDFKGKAIEVEDRASGIDSRARMENGEFLLANNLWFGFGGLSELNAGDNGIIRATGDGEDPTAAFLIDHLATNGNAITNPELRGISRDTDKGLDPRPNFGGAAYETLGEYPDDNFFSPTNYKGAFGTGLWNKGWTALDQYGYLADDVADNVIVIKDKDLVAGETYFWSADNIYLLDGYVFLEEGGILNIQAGTVIQGRAATTTGDPFSALLIARGAKINAIGTRENPIIFTSEFDDGTLTEIDRGLWGGLAICGNGKVSANNDTFEARMEGFSEAFEPVALYGGENDEDNSGILKYVSLRHGGAEIGTGDEINGLSLGGVGSGTTLEYIEVFANSDDGIEIWGGMPEIKYAAVSFCGDDSFDWDLGFRGKGQFWFALQGSDEADNGGEFDGAQPDEPLAGREVSNPTVYNATWIGSGAGATADNTTGWLFRDGTAGTIANSILTDFKGKAIEVEDRASGIDSRQRMENGEFFLGNNVWWQFGGFSELNAGENGIIRATGDAEDPTAAFLIEHLGVNGNSISNPELGGISRSSGSQGLDPRPRFGGAAFQGTGEVPEDDFFVQTSYKGAFGSEIWQKGWTALDALGFFAEDQVPDNLVIIKDGDLNAGGTYNWTNDNIYQLDGYVFLEEGGVLNIQAGTRIQGQGVPSNDNPFSALLIARGAKIFAEGTQENPIIFTSEFDDGDLGPADRGLWGGLAICGNGKVSANNDTFEARMEGFSEAFEPVALYGGENDEDNSGILKYVSLRHGGAEIGTGDEINGLSLGGVGSGTTLEYIEVFANSDDGIEIWGGMPEIKYAAVSFCGDDSFDWDLGFRGKGQFWFALQGSDEADNGGEFDGAQPDEPLAGREVSNPAISNVTWIGSGAGAIADNTTGILMRDGTAGTIMNSILTDFKGKAIEIEDRASGIDSRARMENGETLLANNIWWGFGGLTELNAGDNGIIRTTGDAEDASGQFLIDHLATHNNTISDPGINNIDRGTNGALDPRPSEGSLPYTHDRAAVPQDGFFVDVPFIGAFGRSSTGFAEGIWISGWTALAETGVLDPALAFEAVNIEDLVVEENGFILNQNVPNPFSTITDIRFTLPKAATVQLSVYDMSGKMVTQLVEGERFNSGEHTVSFDAENFAKGVYFYQLTVEETTLTKTMLINK